MYSLRRAALTAHTTLLLAISTAGLLSAATAVARQSAPTPTVEQLRLERLVGEAGARADDYTRLFKDLTAEESKVVEQFRDGAPSKRRRIVSDFVV